jgi:hypothetical protein
MENENRCYLASGLKVTGDVQRASPCSVMPRAATILCLLCFWVWVAVVWDTVRFGSGSPPFYGKHN